MSGVTRPTLRERKKAETRQRIADVATSMFVERGFDNVTITEIAEAAGVSKVTVFNYFPRKEDIFFDRFPQAADLIMEAVRDRREDETPLVALWRLAVDLAERRHPLGGFEDRYLRFLETVVGSAPLRARVREAVAEFEAYLAELLTGVDPHPRLTAALVVAAYRTVYTETAGRMLAGEKAADVTPDHIAAIDHAFGILIGGLR
ncbi:TetR/AcrR family transcriptional regulator [Actinophytocola sp.]|jgi:AcrR family transcriptional regulator|uniref:TetR/AcrR family transcriptional regulator n=1 Tax=Actinophytocola sp. TaxID=1872138 RepID=UPI002D33126A|nr:TetR family transcriptional regulator [Actinophytocola sp.]HYQ67843.1 TetR family transcriptional regulator [Actinophytocola sp.]